VKLRRYALPATTATLAVTLTASSLPAQASHSPVSHSTVYTVPGLNIHHLPKGAKKLPGGWIAVPVPWSVLTHNKAVRHASTTTASDKRIPSGSIYQCFYWDHSYCTATKYDIGPLIDLVEGDVAAVGLGLIVAILWKWINRGGGSDSLRLAGYNPAPRPGWPTWNSNECLGVWGFDNHAHLGSCNSKHGIYWKLYLAYRGNNYAYRMWNTYDRGWLESDKHLSGKSDPLWVGSGGSNFRTFEDFLGLP
jgi:hypothetical protein